MIKVGISGYGIYVPRLRIKTQEIAQVWGKRGDDVGKSLGIMQKSVPSYDEDAVTMAYESSYEALKHSGISPSSIKACFVGSESHPYAVNPTSTIIAEFLGLGRDYFASDLEFACKAATAGIISSIGLISARMVENALVTGSDCAQSKPHDILEYSSASASASYVLTCDSKDYIAEVVETSSYTSDTPDFWRRDGVRFPSHGGRFTGEPAYFAHVKGAAISLLAKTNYKPSDFSYCVFHMPNGKFPRTIAKRLGFTEKQLKPSLTVDYIANPYSASSLIGLSAVLDEAEDGDLIFMVSYGSGAGSDGFIFKVTKNINRKRNGRKTFMDKIKDCRCISYTQYLKNSGKI